MNTPYQAIYDAIRSENISHYVSMACAAVQESAVDASRPFYMLKPRIFIDGDQWCALYGGNVQDGIAGFGKSPREASYNFDIAFGSPLP